MPGPSVALTAPASPSPSAASLSPQARPPASPVLWSDTDTDTVHVSPSPARSEAGNESDSGASIATAPPAPAAGLALSPPSPSASASASAAASAGSKSQQQRTTSGAAQQQSHSGSRPSPAETPTPAPRDPPLHRPVRAQSQAPTGSRPHPRNAPHNTSSYHNHHQHHHHHHHHHHPGMPLDKFQTELTQALVSFLNPLLPTEEEYRTKEALRRNLERIARRIDPTASLLAFGSMANGFALRNSDMDLCCLISPAVAQGQNQSQNHSQNRDQNQPGSPPSASSRDQAPSEPPAPPGVDAPALSAERASALVEQLAQLIRENTDFIVMPLPHARIPIIKISKPASESQAYELACDIGFENRLALENTRLLLSYAMVDPPRLRALVLFLKVWTKRRKINSPYMGTLSSYGYTLLALYYLMHIKQPAVLPNLQRMDLSGGQDDGQPPTTLLQNHDVYFYDDIARVRSEWRSDNTENVGSLLMGFFTFFSKEFPYAHEVISIKSPTGSFPKDPIHWTGDLCIQDPFALQYNVARPVTKAGLYLIRGEFFRASKILANRSQRPATLVADLCEERDDTINPPDPPRYGGNYRPWRGHSHVAPQFSAAALGLGTGAYSAHAEGHHTRSGRHSGNNASGVSGSFAFEAMARGLGKGQHNSVAIVPSQAMLQPLSHSAGLTGKPARGRRPVQAAGKEKEKDKPPAPGSGIASGPGATAAADATPVDGSRSCSPRPRTTAASGGTPTPSGADIARADSAAPTQTSPRTNGVQAMQLPASAPAQGAGGKEATTYGGGAKRVQTRRFSDTSTRTPPAGTVGPRYSQPSSPHQVAAGLVPSLPLAAPALIGGGMVSDARRMRRASARMGEEAALVYYPDGRSAYALDWMRSALPLPLSLPTGQWVMAYPDANEAASSAARERHTPSSPAPSTAGGSPNPTISTEPTTLGAERDWDDELDADKTAR